MNTTRRRSWEADDLHQTTPRGLHCGGHPRRHRSVLWAGLALAGSLGLAACSTGGGAPASASGSSASSSSASGSSASSSSASGSSASHAATIVIHNFAYQPDKLTVAPGTSVTVTNHDSVDHTVTSSTGAFNTGQIASGATSHFTAPSKPGTYPFACTDHPFMTGTLVVS